ncbi:RNA-binding protein [Inquilinus sp. KBS0705]|nr:RNA-binding protein [Inquilinus sp. KBS0705]
MKICYSICCLLCLMCLFACKQKTTFQKISSFHSGIDFENTITENDSINPLDVVNIYNGGGVGVGDFNNDGLPDLYFSGNMVSNKLYLNKGDFKFKDITEEAGVTGMGRWGRGVSVVDINNDGLMDIYVCNTIYPDSARRRNLLYINQGLDKDGIPHFKNMANDYNLQAGIESTMASFFDYDNDGDLDMYLTVNNASSTYNPNIFGSAVSRNPHIITGKLFRNDWDSKLKHPVFHDVTIQAGLTISGFGHSASTVDMNGDGWKDIYVSNDFISNNILYINNKNGTFTDRSREYFKHTSLNSMGQDVVDINNDGLADVVELDMNPEDNFRKKMMLGPNSYQLFQNFDMFGNEYQYVRNTLQLNQGNRLMQNDSIGSPVFSEIAFLSGVAQTDWSWTPLVQDFNNDGYRDMIITNGFPKDVSDRDFMTYRQQAYAAASKETVLKQIPEIKLHNYVFKNNGNLTFQDVSNDWGLSQPTFSNGAVYADLDNDGAMDMVINNVNDKALVYRNTSRDNEKTVNNAHFLQISFKGEKQNINGVGTIVNIYYNGKQQVYENTPYRGYLSTVQNIAHFGLGGTTTLDSVIIKWPGGKSQKMFNVKADQRLKADVKNAKDGYQLYKPEIAFKALFKEVTDSLGINYKHKEFAFVDFNIQKLLPHKLSEYSPALAAGDVDNNGLDDIVIGGNSNNPAQLFLQMPNGKFKQKDMFATEEGMVRYKDAGLLLFDANGDGHLDLYAASGGYEAPANSAEYKDRFYINDGKGNFIQATGAIPANFTSKMCVKACDYNKDGKPDLFISGRVEPWSYPKPVSSIILRNDTKNGRVKFTDVTAEVAPALKNIGLVCDALFTDFDNDGWPDLIMAGEWMPVTFLKNDHGKFTNITSQTGVSNKFGWWNSIVAGDFRHTGRTDYIIGNVGENTLLKGTDKYPVYITAKDFDKSGYSAIPSIFLKDKNGDKKEFPVQGRDDMLKQMISMKKKFTNYKSYALATMDDILSPEQKKGALRLKANMMQSCYLRNDGNNKFTLIPLPTEAQVSVINGMETGDFDGDGNLDVVLNGNDYGTDVSIGRYDALNGLMLKGDGKGGFKPLGIMQSGIYIPGDGKALVKLRDTKGNLILAASQNKDYMKVFKLKKQVKTVPVGPSIAYALIKHQNGKVDKQEFYYGSSFLSQSTRFLNITPDVESISLYDNSGIKSSIKTP